MTTPTEKELEKAHQLGISLCVNQDGVNSIALALAETAKGAICPECRVKSLSEYQDKYGIVEEEWTREQMLEAMRSIHYERMDMLRKIAEGRAAGLKTVWNYLQPALKLLENCENVWNNGEGDASLSEMGEALRMIRAIPSRAFAQPPKGKP